METLTSNDGNTLNVPLMTMAAGDHDRDWRTYLDACREIDNNATLDAGQMLALKQACALAYLRKLAQTEGGVYSKARMRILTPEFVQLMSRTNTAQRYKRYPWLESLLVLRKEIDEVQDQTALRSKVLSIMTLKQPMKLQMPRA